MAANTTSPLNRRQFLKNSALLSGGVALLPTLLAGCDEPDELQNYTGSFSFHEGVASFDPTATGVLLWTRYTPADNEPRKLSCGGK